MPVQTRYRITDRNVSDVRSFPTLSTIPRFLQQHKDRLSAIDEIVAVVSNRSHTHPTFVRLNAFHRHQTPYAAIDALAPPLAEFFIQTDILPIVDPIFDRFKEHIAEYSPRLCQLFVERGILIDREARE